MALILITHDLGVVAEVADRAAVMYAGRIVEAGSVDALFHSPAHPYLRGLLDSRPSTSMQGGELRAIPGQPPNPAALPTGCAYRPRCDRSQGRSACETVPPLAGVAPGHEAACHFAAESVLLPDPRSRVV
jgi:oligopeptide transport system ATP-binding protein